MFYPKSLENLIDSFKMLPGIGEKTAERLAFSILDCNEDAVTEFGNSLLNIKNNIKKCKVCGSLTDNDVCFICSDSYRDKSKIIVVKDPKDVFNIEKLGNYNGLYHVLGGLISPIDELGPDDLSINDLINRIKTGMVSEVILAINSGIESDITSLYLKKVLSKENVVVTRIASGIPIGADMDYVDSLTLESALNNRKEVLDN